MRKFVIGRVRTKPGVRSQYITLAKPFIETSRAEPGCIYYQQAADDDDPDSLVVIECWASPEEHAAHTAAPYFAAFVPTFERFVVQAHFEEMDVDDVHDVVVNLG